MHALFTIYNETIKEDTMKNTKKAKSVSKKRVVKNKDVTLERERVAYSFDNKSKSIRATFKTHAITITQAQVKELASRVDDIKRFYSYCNSEINLLAALHCDAQAKKTGACVNTQYDSRKKLRALVMQVTMTKLKQKAKSKSKKIKK